MLKILVIRLLSMTLAAGLATIALYVAFRMLFEDGPHLVFALIGGVLIGVAAGMFRNAMDWLARRRLLGGASGRMGEGGRREIALRGQIIAREPPIRIPFLDGPVISASYSVTEKGQVRRVHGAKGSSANIDHVHMAGLIAVPCALRVEGCDVPIFAFPSPFDFPEAKRPAAEIAAQLLAHADSGDLTRHARFAPADAVTMLDSYSQDVGAGRRDEFALPSLSEVVSKPDATFRVQAIPEGAEVCVIGTYEPGASGLVASMSWGGLGIYPGNPADARAFMLRKAAGNGAVAALMTAFASVGLGAILALVQIDDARRLTDLRHAIDFGQIEIARPLLERGLSIDADDMRQLVAAAPNGPTLGLLAEFGAELDGLDENGFPLLIAAAMRGDVERLRDLLEAGASPEIRGGPGRLSALEWAADQGDMWTAQFLQEAGVPGRVAEQSRLKAIDNVRDPAVIALMTLYASTAAFPATGGFEPGSALNFEGGHSDGVITTLYVNGGKELRAHVMERRGNGWTLLRVTPVSSWDG